MKLVILNGFDRSGTSYIGGLLSRHPRINYFFQPFSGTEVHRSQYEVWDENTEAPVDEGFIERLQRGRIDWDYLASDWFKRYSQYAFPACGRAGLIKETKLHTKVRWLKQRFPEIPVYGIWRDPRAVLCSLVRNGFHEKWYGASALENTRRLIATEDSLSGFRPFCDERIDAVQSMALVMAVRSELFAENMDPDKWIIYEQVLDNPDYYLNRFCRKIGLTEYSFSEYSRQNYNASGLPFTKPDLWKDYFNKNEVDRIDRIFGSMKNVANAA